MDLKYSLILCTFLAGVYCQYDNQYVIDQTQYLQQIEKYNKNFNNSGYNNIYPQLNSSDLRGLNNTNGQRHSPANVTSFDANKNFLNKTISNMPKGVCVKEVL